MTKVQETLQIIKKIVFKRHRFTVRQHKLLFFFPHVRATRVFPTRQTSMILRLEADFVTLLRNLLFPAAFVGTFLIYVHLVLGWILLL